MTMKDRLTEKITITLSRGHLIGLLGVSCFFYGIALQSLHYLSRLSAILDSIMVGLIGVIVAVVVGYFTIEKDSFKAKTSSQS